MGFVWAVHCLRNVQTEVAFFLFLLVVCYSPIVYKIREAIFASKLPESAGRRFGLNV